jgi:hypothetical protein
MHKKIKILVNEIINLAKGIITAFYEYIYLPMNFF